MAPATIRLGTASPSTKATTRETLEHLEQLTRRAAAKKVDLLLLPEAYLGGYPRGTAFGCVIGGRAPGGREEYLRYFQGAVDLGDTVGDGAGAGSAWIRRELSTDAVGPVAEDHAQNGETQAANKRGDGTREELERIARETGVFLVTGCIEKAGGSLYCSVVYVCPTRGIIGKRRKVMPTGTERLIWAQGSPATLQAVSTIIRGVRINLAAAICWENYMPLLRQALYAQNINLYLAPTADGRDTWLPLLRTVAIEGRCFVVSSNMCVRAGGGSASDTTTTTTTAQQQHQAVSPTHRQERPSRHEKTTADRDRRASCVTAEGFEIALPSPSPTRSKSRRKSVFDQDGNEIVLSCEDTVVLEDADDEEEDPRSTSPVRFRDTLTNGHAPSVAATATAGASASAPVADEYLTRGGSSIVSPFGDVLAGPQWEDEEGIICADVDFEDCIKGRLDLDTAGHYSRNDSFKFSVEGLPLNPLPYY